VPYRFEAKIHETARGLLDEHHAVARDTVTQQRPGAREVNQVDLVRLERVGQDCKERVRIEGAVGLVGKVPI
jgi:hypothetical protein